MSVPASAPLQSAIAVACGLLLATGTLAQTSPPGPTVPKRTGPEDTLPVPGPGDSMVLNPTLAECKAGWRPGLRWTKERFDKFCAQFRISK